MHRAQPILGLIAIVSALAACSGDGAAPKSDSPELQRDILFAFPGSDEPGAPGTTFTIRYTQDMLQNWINHEQTHGGLVDFTLSPIPGTGDPVGKITASSIEPGHIRLRIEWVGPGGGGEQVYIVCREYLATVGPEENIPDPARRVRPMNPRTKQVLYDATSACDLTPGGPGLGTPPAPFEQQRGVQAILDEWFSGLDNRLDSVLERTPAKILSVTVVQGAVEVRCEVMPH